MRQTGTALQVLVLMALPMLIPFQLSYGMPLIVMPAATVVGIGLFSLGHYLRNK